MSERLELVVPAGAAGRRLDTWLADSAPLESRAAAQQLIDAGRVLVDGQPRAKSFRLAGGEQVSADLVVAEPVPKPVEAEPRVAFEDEHLVIVDKPAGLVVHPAPGHRSETLVDLLAERAAGAWSPLVVHRLDRDTSGLMLVAKDPSTKGRLQDLIRRRELEREYVALVGGRLEARRGEIEAPLGRDPDRRTRMSPRAAKARPARTRFAVESFLERSTLVRAWLDTGRTHQIRAHFAAIGHPLAGDPAYGGGTALGLRRQFLHSARIAFRHPRTGERLERRSALPEDLRAALERARAERRG